MALHGLMFITLLNILFSFLKFFDWIKKNPFAQSAGAVEYTDCFSAEG